MVVHVCGNSLPVRSCVPSRLLTGVCEQVRLKAVRFGRAVRTARRNGIGRLPRADRAGSSGEREREYSIYVFLKHPFSLVGAAILAPLHFLSGAMLEMNSEFAVSAGRELPFAIFAMLPVAVAFSLALPHLRARWFFRDASFPHFAYVLPRWMICLVSTSLIGSGVGLVAAGVVYAKSALPMGLVHCVSWLAFAYSASARCRKPATAEFSVRWLPRSPLRWR